MTYLFQKKQSSAAIVGAVVLAVGACSPVPANTFSPAPLFKEVKNYNTTITTNGDAADIYFPAPSNSNISTQKFPIALLLPGALVDKSYYSNFASIVARYGFVVVVPNHTRSLPSSTSPSLLAEASQINNVLAYMVRENSNPTSPIAGTLDTKKLVLLGHSFGGAVGMTAIENSCIFPLCQGRFTRPNEVVAGVFYGTHRKDLKTGQFSTTKNGRIAIALVEGSRDGVATPDEVQGTYELIENPPKALITVEGANHFGITNVNNPPGAKADSSSPTLEQNKGVEAIARWSALFLRSHALNDAGALDYVYKTGDALDENVRAIGQISSVAKPSALLSLFRWLVPDASTIGFWQNYKHVGVNKSNF